MTRVQRVLGLVEKLDRFFETCDAVLRPPQKPICAGHVGVKFAEHERGGVLADDLDAEFEILDRFFAVAFLVIAVRDLAIGLGHAEPVAVLAKMVECLYVRSRGRSGYSLSLR